MALFDGSLFEETSGHFVHLHELLMEFSTGHEGVLASCKDRGCRIRMTLLDKMRKLENTPSKTTFKHMAVCLTHSQDWNKPDDYRFAIRTVCVHCNRCHEHAPECCENMDAGVL